MSGSVSMVDGHIDLDKSRMTAQQAIKYFEDEILMLENAPNLNGCEMTDEWREQIEICKMAKQALKKQIPKKVILAEEECNCPNCLFDMMGVYVFSNDDITDPKFCTECGQALDWSDTE